MDKFLRIIGSKEYENYLRENRYKYIPKKITYMFQDKIKPRVICDYIRKDTEKVVGYGIGVFLKEDILTREEYIKRIIDSINRIREQEMYKDIEYLITDNLNLCSDEVDEVLKQTNIKIPQGRKHFSENIVKLLNKVCKVKGQDLEDQEVLILSDDTDFTLDITNDISKVIKFLNIHSSDEVFAKNLEKSILEKTGLSLHIAKNLERILSNVNIVINLNEDINIDIKNMKKDTIIIDLSKNRVLSREIYKDKKILAIDDMFLRNDRGIYSTRKDCDLKKQVNTSLSEFLKNSNQTIVNIKIYDKIYNVDEGINAFSFQNRNTSSFDKK